MILCIGEYACVVQYIPKRFIHTFINGPITNVFAVYVEQFFCILISYDIRSLSVIRRIHEIQMLAFRENTNICFYNDIILF